MRQALMLYNPTLLHSDPHLHPHLHPHLQLFQMPVDEPK